MAVLVGVVLFVAGALRNDSLDYWYLSVNLLLGLIPLMVIMWLRHWVSKKGWRNWSAALLLVAWLLFLPNSFYIITDFIHLPEVARVDIVQDVVMLMQFSILGLVAGFTSLYILHSLLLKKLGASYAMMIVVGSLYLSSFAIYLGRVLRWNSWDILLHPFLVVKDALLIWWSPISGASAIWMTISFFMLLTSLYLLLWYGVNALRAKN